MWQKIKLKKIYIYCIIVTWNRGLKKKNITGWPTRKKQKQNLVAGQWRNSIITTWDWNSKRQATVSAHSCLFLCRGAYSGCPKICIYIYIFFLRGDGGMWKCIMSKLRLAHFSQEENTKNTACGGVKSQVAACHSSAILFHKLSIIVPALMSNLPRVTLFFFFFSFCVLVSIISW